MKVPGSQCSCRVVLAEEVGASRRVPLGLLPPANHSLSPLSCQPLSQPGSPAPGPPAQMDLEHPPQPLFGTPTPLLKKEPPGYEEAMIQQPRQQVKKVD